MERVLGYRRKSGLWLGTILTIIAGVVCSEGLAYAFYLGQWTGYAMGRLSGSANVVLDLGHAARHNPSRCPTDPAAYWPFGSYIVSLSGPIRLQECSENIINAYTFTLADTGDNDCSEGHYWIDVYFGRCKRPADPCSCGGVSDSVCYPSNTVNSCNNAINFGRKWMFYEGPGC